MAKVLVGKIFYPDGFHPRTVEAEVAIPQARGGPHLDTVGGFIDMEFHIIDEAEEGSLEFRVKIILPAGDDPGAVHGPDDFGKLFHGAVDIFPDLERGNSMGGIVLQGTDAIGFGPAVLQGVIAQAHCLRF
mgnify:CR=1 FL=1